MPDLVLHLRTKKQAERVLTKPPQALLILGPAGSGKFQLANHLSASLLDVKPDELTKHPYFSLITKPPDKRDIPIDSIRHIIKQLSLKAAHHQTGDIKRVLLIKDANLMSTEAQNALLKVLEEPPSGSVFILTALSDTSVLPTIASRAEKLMVSPISIEDALQQFSPGFSQKQVESAWSLSGGASALMEAILKDDQSHPLKQSVETAKRILAGSTYDRILLFDNLSGDKVLFADALDALSRILTALQHAAIKSGNHRQSSRLLRARKLINNSIHSLETNASPKLLALNLAEQLLS
jgi:hypothetical protein